MGKDDLALQFWSPKSPDLKPSDFFLWGLVRDAVYVPPPLKNLNDLRNRITAAVNSVTQDIRHQVWDEFNYRLDHGCANHDTEGKRFKSPIHCCDVTKPPYLFSGELGTSPLHCKLLFVYTVCCRRTGQWFSVLRTRKSDVILT